MAKERWSEKEGRQVEAPEIDAFLEEIAKVCRKHGLSISHEDEHGSFRIGRFSESNLEWLFEAADAREGKA